MDRYETAITKATVSLLKVKPFFAHIFQQIEKVYIDNRHPLKTMGIGLSEDRKRFIMLISKDYIEKCLEESDQISIICKSIEHEVLHIVFKHVSVDPSSYDKGRMNIAMDLSCNQYIQNPPDTWYTINKYKFPSNMNWKWYYDNLPKTAGKPDDSHQYWPGNDSLEHAQSQLNNIINQAAKSCKDTGYGDLSFSVISQIESILPKKEVVKRNWKQILRNFAANSVETDIETTVMRVSKRFGTRPGIVNRSRLNLACTIDISASISDIQILEFISQIEQIRRNDVDVTIIEADSEVKHHYKFNGKFDGKIHGRGGTNLEPAMKFVQEHRFDAHVYFTDFQAPPVKGKYKTPILWLITSQMPKQLYPCKYGKVIVMEKECSKY